MGIGVATAKWLLLMKKRFDVDFSNTAMLGRQTLVINKNISPFFDMKDITQPDGYSEKFFSALAGKRAHVDSFDFSEYEHATVLHDMNKPILDEHKNKYGVVFDGGTLEHVFNYPVALWNTMNMVSQQLGGGIFFCQLRPITGADTDFINSRPNYFSLS